MPATTWTKLTTPAGGFQESRVDPFLDASTDYFIDFLFEGTAFSDPGASTWTEASMSATSFTEQTVGATTWTESSG